MSMGVKSIIVQSTNVGGALAHYPHAKLFPDGKTLYLSGVSARQSDNTVLGVEHNANGTVTTSIAQQTAVLEEAGGSLADLVDVTVFLANMADYAEFNMVYNRYFTAETGPSRTTVGVLSLPGPHLLIEIKGVAYLKDRSA